MLLIINLDRNPIMIIFINNYAQDTTQLCALLKTVLFSDLT